MKSNDGYFEVSIFFLTGSLQPKLGDGILAHNISREDLENRVNEYPFVVENLLSAEILEITPAKAEKQLEFLLD